MHPFTLTKVDTLSGAIEASQSGARYIAGGTTLVDLMREEVERPSRLVDINALPLAQVGVDASDLVIGAMSRMADVAANPTVRRLQPLVAEALEEGASPQIRNMASIGGNLLQRVRCPYFRQLDARCNKRNPGSGCAAKTGVHHNHAIFGGSEACFATHPSDLAVALVALEATVRLLGPDGDRSIPVEDLIALPGTTPHVENTLQPHELIVEIRVPGGAHSRSAKYLKVRDRASYEFALVSAAVALALDGDIIASARVACGGVGTKPWRLRKVESLLVGERIGKRAFQSAGDAAVANAKPGKDNRYKVALLRHTVSLALEMAAEARP